MQKRINKLLEDLRKYGDLQEYDNDNSLKTFIFEYNVEISPFKEMSKIIDAVPMMVIINNLEVDFLICLTPDSYKERLEIEKMPELVNDANSRCKYTKYFFDEDGDFNAVGTMDLNIYRLRDMKNIINEMALSFMIIFFSMVKNNG